ncbi:MAG: basic amino acid ABC transporter substrate-binding protein [Burkholderiaceae bacterium]|nr:basic amino acid ABC transporter substrate-binding protein [Burkholderiaceae bacterium]
MFKRTLLVLPVVALLSSTLLTGCDDSKTTATKTVEQPTQKILRIGTNPTFAPFEFQGTNHELVGFDLDLIHALGKQMGYKIEVSNLGFDALIPAISSGNIDAAISGMSITEVRKKAINFSNPYYTSGLSILVHSDNNDIKSLKDLEGKKIAVQIGTTGAEKASTVKDATVVSFNNSNEPFMELNNKGVDAAISDHPVIAYYLVQGGSGKIVGERMNAEDYGIALKKGNDKLTKEFNDALNALKQNGEYDKIYKKWFGS